MKLLNTLIALCAACLLTLPTYAGGMSNRDKIKIVIINSDGLVYFTSTKACPNWCKLNPAWTKDQIDRSYSMLMTAAATGGDTSMYWLESATNDSCVTTPLPVYSSPYQLMFHGQGQ
jgi:hypothetical protein